MCQAKYLYIQFALNFFVRFDDQLSHHRNITVRHVAHRHMRV